MVCYGERRLRSSTGEKVMWQITWMLSFLPDWFWTLLLITGVLALLAAWVLKSVPVISNYRLPIQVGGILALLVGIYFQGVMANEEKWQARVKELEEQVAAAEAKSKEVNVKVEEKIIYKDKVIKERGQKQIEYIDRVVKEREEVKVFIEHCPIPTAIIDEHNKAAIRDLNKAAKEKK